MAEEIRKVVARGIIYLPGGTHGFPPGSEVPVSASVEADLRAAGHLVEAEPAAEAKPEA